MQLAELTVRGFADLLGSAAPAPGGGSAAGNYKPFPYFPRSAHKNSPDHSGRGSCFCICDQFFPYSPRFT